MRKRAKLSSACATALLLAGCGQYLGAYTVEGVEIVQNLPKPFSSEVSPGYDRYLEVRVDSKTSLTAIADKVDGVYVDADFCPLRNSNGVIALGPVSDDGQDLSLPSAAPALRPSPNGHFRYRIYVVVNYRAWTVGAPGQIQLPTYDLRMANRDICLRLFGSEFNIVHSRSETVRIPADMISTALKNSAAGVTTRT